MQLLLSKESNFRQASPPTDTNLRRLQQDMLYKRSVIEWLRKWFHLQGIQHHLHLNLSLKSLQVILRVLWNSWSVIKSRKQQEFKISLSQSFLYRMIKALIQLFNKSFWKLKITFKSLISTIWINCIEFCVWMSTSENTSNGS